MQVILPVEDEDKLDLIILVLIIFRGDANKLINIISEAKLIKTFDDKDRLIIDKFVLFKMILIKVLLLLIKIYMQLKL